MIFGNVGIPAIMPSPTPLTQSFFSGSFVGANTSSLSFVLGGCFGVPTRVGEFLSGKAHEQISNVGAGSSGQVVMQSSNAFPADHLYRYDALISLGVSDSSKYPLGLWGLANNFYDPYCSGLPYEHIGFQTDISTGVYNFVIYVPPVNITYSTGISAVNDVNVFTKFSIVQPNQNTIKAYINDVLLNTWNSTVLQNWTANQWFCLSAEWFSPYTVDAYMKSLNIQTYI